MFLPGNILYLENNILKTLNLTSFTTHAIIGPADFKSPHTFFQMNSTTVIMINSRNYCVQSVSRITNQTSLVAGLCGESGRKDGSFLQARFGEIFGNVRLPYQRAFVMEKTTGNVKMLDFITEKVSTSFNLVYQLIGAAMRWSTKDLYFSYVGGIGKASLTTGNVQYFSVDTYEPVPLRQNHANYWVISIHFVTDNVLLIADQGQNIKALDVSRSSISEICSRPASHRNVFAGNMSECRAFEPQSFLVLPDENRIMVGFVYSIGYIDISGRL